MKFGVDKSTIYPFLHAKIDPIGAMWGDELQNGHLSDLNTGICGADILLSESTANYRGVREGVVANHNEHSAASSSTFRPHRMHAVALSVCLCVSLCVCLSVYVLDTLVSCMC